MATAVTLLAKEPGLPTITFQVLFYQVTDANFDSQAYMAYQEGYWLTYEAMKWFWNNYALDNASRKEPTVSPLQAGFN
jgi:acetyl esterase